MRFTKLGHSCVRLEKDGAVLVIDPGMWSDAPEALAGAAAVLVTHEHPDHLDADAVRAALSSDPGVTLWANQSICAQFTEFGDRVHEVGHGDALDVAGFRSTFTAWITRSSTRTSRSWSTPGSASTASCSIPATRSPSPRTRSATLLVPLAAPWQKAAEMIDYFRAVGPARGYAIHDAILNDNGLGLYGRMLTLAAAPSGATVARLEPGTTLDL